jgi:hypothetical protein
MVSARGVERSVMKTKGCVMRSTCAKLCLASSILVIAACDGTGERSGPGAGGGGNGNGGGGGETTAVFLSSQLLAPNGTTPVANATVYQEDDGSFDPSPKNLVVGIDCPTPKRSFLTAVCSAADGSFTLPAQARAGKVTLRVEKGAFQQSFEVNVPSAGSEEEPVDIGAVSLASNTGDGAPKIAVIAGIFDSIEDVVEEIGLTDFDLFESESAVEALFSPASNPTLTDYDIVFINCGAPVVVDSTAQGEQRRDYLRSYVEAGGRLYVTDLAADYITTTFPEFVDFAGDGVGGQSTQADVLVDVLGEYLDLRSCSNLEGSAVDCRNPDGTVDITGLASGWRVIEGAAAGQDAVVTFYTRGEVEYFSDISGEALTEVRPLNFTFPVGLGSVLYSSYHTASDGAIGLPQERVLEYLVFE